MEQGLVLPLEINGSLGKLYITRTGFYFALKDPRCGLLTLVRANDSLSLNRLEKIVLSEGSREEKDAYNKSVDSIREFDKLMRNYISEGYKDLLDGFLLGNGYPSSRILQGRDATNFIDAIAFTDRDSIFGVYRDFSEQVRKLQKQGNISEKIANYIIITHELIHTSQRVNLEALADPREEQRIRLNMEYEAEMLVMAMLYYKASLNPLKEYVRAAQYIRKRVEAIERLARIKGVELRDRERLEGIVSSYMNVKKAA